MPFFDIGVLILLAIGAFTGLKKGLVKQLLGLLGLFIGTYWAYIASEGIAKIFTEQYGTSPSQTRIVAFIALLIVIYILILILAFLINKMLKLAMLGWLNKLMGMLLGLLTMSLIICVFVFIVDSLSFIEVAGGFTNSIKASVSYPIFLELTKTILPFLDLFKEHTQGIFTNLFNPIVP